MAEWNSAPASSTATIFNEDTPLANKALVKEWLDNQRRLEDYARVAEEEREADAMRHEAALGNMLKGYRSMLREKLKDGELMTDKELWTLTDGNEDDFDRLRMERDMDLKKALDDDRLKPHSLEPKEQPTKLEAFIFGYDPDATVDDEEFDPNVIDAAYLVPGIGHALYGNSLLDQIKRGGMPGFAEMAMAVPYFGPDMKKAAKSFVNGFKNGRSRRFAEGMKTKRQNLLDMEKKVLDDKGRELQRIDVYPWD